MAKRKFTKEQLFINGIQFSSPEEIAKHYDINENHVRACITNGDAASLGKRNMTNKFKVRGQVYSTDALVEAFGYTRNWIHELRDRDRLNVLGLDSKERFKVIELYYTQREQHIKKINEMLSELTKASDYRRDHEEVLDETVGGLQDLLEDMKDIYRYRS